MKQAFWIQAMHSRHGVKDPGQWQDVCGFMPEASYMEAIKSLAGWRKTYPQETYRLILRVDVPMVEVKEIGGIL